MTDVFLELGREVANALGKPSAAAAKPLTLAGYVARGGNVYTAYVEPLAEIRSSQVA